MPLCGATFDENVGGARVSADTRAAILLADKTFRVAAGTAPPTFGRQLKEDSLTLLWLFLVRT